MTTLLQVFPEPDDLLRIPPEDLAGIVMEIIPEISQSAGFTFGNLEQQVFPPTGGGYRPHVRHEVNLAISEALAWLKTQGLLVDTPGQVADWMCLTRAGRQVTSRADLDSYIKGRELPISLLHETLKAKVYSLFLRGDHDVAVFQAFKEVEVAVRAAGGYANDVTGRDLMMKAFHKDTGPLTDMTLVTSEREAEAFLFAGAIGHAKNPGSHRPVAIGRETAAQLITFARYLLSIVEGRP